MAASKSRAVEREDMGSLRKNSEESLPERLGLLYAQGRRALGGDIGMLKTLAGFLLRRQGWIVEGEVPPVARCVVVAAPHTSNWDLLYLLLMAWSKGLKISPGWPSTVCSGRPSAGSFARLGGSRGATPPEQRVSATAALFGAVARLYLVIPPEGTRSRTAHWKSGFYWIAREAEVPVQLTALDYTTKAGTFGPLLDASASPSAFMDQVRAFYAGRHGRYPDDFGPVRLEDEGDRS